MSSLEVGSSLFMRGGAEFEDEVVLRSAKVGGQLDMSNSKFKGKLNMAGLEVADLFVMQQAEFAEVLLPFAEIRGNFDLSGATLNSIDLTGTRIHGEFRLASDQELARWQEDSKLILRNTEVGVLYDLPEAWPGDLQLDGFNYSSLGSLGADDSNAIAARDISWFEEWLEKQKTYSPQPYEQLASVLENAGHTDRARDVLYASKERQRSEVGGSYWLWLTLLKLLIGYGYKNFQALIGLCLFWVVGWICLKGSGQASKSNLKYGGLAYSLDMLLPVIKLREKHYKIDLSGPVRVYFYVHKIMGYVLVFFLIAGLTGLTES